MDRIAYVEPRDSVNAIGAELLLQLSHYYDVDLFTEPEGSMLDRRLLASYNVHAYAELSKRSHYYEERIYHLRNEGLYIGPYDLLIRHGGVAVLHDLNLSGIIGAKTLLQGRRMRFLNAVRSNEGMSAFLRTAFGVIRYKKWPSWHEYPMLRNVLEHSNGVIVHNDSARDELLNLRPLLRVQTVPLAFPLSKTIEPEAARLSLGLAKYRPIIASYGVIHQRKRVDVALEAFASVASALPESVFVLVGKEAGVDVKALLDRFALHDKVIVTGWVDDDKLEEYLAAADIVVNLRYPTEGETSSMALRAMSHGKPVVVSDAGSLAELQSEGAIKIAVGPDETKQLRNALMTLSGDVEKRNALGSAAEEYVSRFHSPARAALKYHEFLEDLRSTQTRQSSMAKTRPII